MKSLDTYNREGDYYKLFAWGNNGERVKLLLDKDDAEKTIPRGRWATTVFNHADNKVLKIRSASCGTPYCMCDLAIVKEII